MISNCEQRLRGRKTGAALGLIIVAGLLLFLLVSCATWREHETLQTERLLSAAGFQLRLADTPEKTAQLDAFRPRTLTPQERDGKLYYVYADRACGCLYVGTEKAYQRYQQLAAQMKIAEENLEAAQMNRETQMDWDAWGPWGPWW